MSEKPQVLCVDDEPNVLAGVKRHLRRDFVVVTAAGGTVGLRALGESSFAAVVSDLRMPGMDGIEFLGQVRDQSPDTTRILLTGNADLTAAVSAVNDGNIFRFLTKPCPPDTLLSAVSMAVDQHRLVTAERELLERTLHGSIQMLTEALGLASPESFGQAMRVKRRAGEVAGAIGAPERWKMEMAAMLSRVAYVTVPEATLVRMQQPGRLSESEQAMIDRLPEVAERLLADLPRMDDVREILRRQNERFDDRSTDIDGPPMGARILKAVLDLEVLESQGVACGTALDTMAAEPGGYDPAVLAALTSGTNDSAETQDIRSVPITGLKVGWVLIDPVETTDGRLLMAQGQEVSVGLLERLRNVSVNMSIAEPLRVLVPPPVEAPGATRKE